MHRCFLVAACLLAGCGPRFADIAQGCGGSVGNSSWEWTAWNAPDLAWVEVEAWAGDELLGVVDLAPRGADGWFVEVTSDEMKDDCLRIDDRWSIFRAETRHGEVREMWVGAPGTPPWESPSSFPPPWR